MNIAILPTQRELLNDNLFDTSKVRDNVLERFEELRQSLEKMGHQCHTLDRYPTQEVDILLLSNFATHCAETLKVLRENPCVRIIYTAIEPQIICPLHSPLILGDLPFDIVLTWNLTITEKFAHIKRANIGEPIIKVASIPAVKFNDKNFICMISANKTSTQPDELYSERLKAVDFFSRTAEGFDLYGVGWGRNMNPAITGTYKGEVTSKKDVMKNYKFSVCYENVKGERGLVTEKIFDCFAAGCVPIYYGAVDIANHIPKDCFIDVRDFRNYAELYCFLRGMAEKDYRGYLVAAKDFLTTDTYWEFTSQAFARNVIDAIEILQKKNDKKNFFHIKLNLMWNILTNIPFYLRNLKKSKRFIFDVVTAW